MELKIFLLLIWLHFLGDFIAQTNEMAINKSRSNKWLLIHVSVYCVPFLLFGITFALVNWVAHFATDYCTSRLAAYFNSKDNKRAFFVVLGCDQAIHLTTLVITFHLFGSFNLF
jgi:hypothetical protein